MEHLIFGGLDPEYSGYAKASYVVLPVPYDVTSTWQKGADKGPAAIIEASGNMELYVIETQNEPYKAGIFTADPIVTSEPPEHLFHQVLEATHRFLTDGKFVVTIGGDHSVSIGACKAHCDRYPSVSILQIDAHADMRESYQGSPFNHACVMARMKEWGKPVMVGIRSMDRSELKNIEQADIFYASYIRKHSNWIRQVVDCLDDHVYLTIDLDGFDPSIMPATGTPEPGGLYWHETMELIETVVREKKLIGFDVVELCPNENSHPSHFMAAKLIYNIIAFVEFYLHDSQN